MVKSVMNPFGKIQRKLELHFIRPLSSYIGFKKLKRLSLKKDNPVWARSFNNKKILIVGTGPSLNKVKPEYFLRFDTIIYINHAIKLAGKSKDEYFFSTDIDVASKIQEKYYIQNIIKLGSERSILAPIHFNSLLKIDKDFIDMFSFITANEAYYKTYKSNKPFVSFIYRRHIYWPVQPNYQNLEEWFSQNEQVLFFPVIESTSALSAILFAAKYLPNSISLIGCDFSKGRSKLVAEDNPAKEFNPFSESKERFIFLQKFLDDKGVKVNNDSWSYN